MLDMINLSLDLLKMERGVYELKPTPVDIVQVLKKIEMELDLIRETKKVSLKMAVSGYSLKDDDTFMILGEELLCYSMLANLTKNAIEASPNGESIIVELDKKQVPLISIYNKGTVPKEIRGRFFEKYTTSGKASGTGLGTYSAKLIVETQQGQINMDSSEENGTTISIQLPEG